MPLAKSPAIWWTERADSPQVERWISLIDVHLMGELRFLNILFVFLGLVISAGVGYGSLDQIRILKFNARFRNEIPKDE
jgi:hypothetical protein